MSQGHGLGHGEDRDLPPRNNFSLPVKTPRKADVNAQPHNKLLAGMLQGALELELRVLSPVFVGSGAYDLADSEPVKAPMLCAGRPVIPGTSIKGICRQAHEAITESASPWAETEKTSRSGSLFGRLGFQGRVSFDDAAVSGDVALRLIRSSVAYSPQEARGRRFYGPQPLGVKQPLRTPGLAIPAETCLRMQIRVRNVLNDELGALLLALGVNSFTPKLGGAKYDRWGWVRFQPIAWRRREPFHSSCLVEGKELELFINELLKISEAILPPGGKKNLRELRKKMQAPLSEIGGTA